MLDISVIILTYNEEIHIRRCIENIKQFTDQVYLVDSFSTDKTIEIAKEYGAIIFQNKWENNHAKQLNWALKNLPIQTKWILRLDADEYLTSELVDELKQKLPSLVESVSGVVFKRRHVFLGKWIKRGVYPVKLLRLFQNHKAVCEQRLMDEHMILLEGKTIEFEHDFVDHNLNNLSWWIAKHNGYAIRETVELLNIEYDLIKCKEENNNEILQLEDTRKTTKKDRYARMPLFLRSFLYFFLRYVIQKGFLEGKEGFLWHFLQGWWYRTLVDATIFEVKKACGNDKEKIVIYLREKYNVDCHNQ